MRETELKSVVPDEEACVAQLLAAGARPGVVGRLEDRRFDTADFALASRDIVLRLRVLRTATLTRATLDYKGPASYEGGFKHRDETSVSVGDAEGMVAIVEGLGLRVSREIDREIRVFEFQGASVRFERYPRMDTLVEVEGTPAAIEQAIATLALPREGFTPERLIAFVQRYEARTGEQAAVCDREARGEYRFALDYA